MAIGGSTTYCVGVSDSETWPALLQSSLGENFEVLNLGVPGHGTAEHLYTLGSIASQLAPDVVVFHTGLNDMHCMHDAKNTPTLNRCHSDLADTTLGNCYANTHPRLAILRSLITFLQNVKVIPSCSLASPLHNVERDVDLKIAAAYRIQLSALVSITRGLGSKAVIVPQVGFNDEMLQAGKYRWWTPNLDQSKLEDLLKSFNAISRETAQAGEATYVGSVESSDWPDRLFSDSSHLTAEGNQQLANLVGAEIKKLNLK